jgi:DNA-binding NarL/FixJ family response regulator
VIDVVVADDQAMVRAGLRSLLESEEDITVVGDAADGQTAVDLILRLQPDIALMDIRMPVLDGIAATKQIVESGIRTRVIVVTTFDLDEYVFGALHAGASGFLLKDATAEDLVAAIHTIAKGDALLSPTVTRRVIDAFVKVKPLKSRAACEISDLSDRELEVLGFLAQGLSNSEIADALVVSLATVKTHVSNILAKLGARDRVQAVIAAYESGVVLPGAWSPEDVQ